MPNYNAIPNILFSDAGGEDGEKKEKVEDVETAEAEKPSAT